ncbi:MAG: hypothetical protein P8179_17475 [Candidatus Thiodiazotropha sp.]
MKVSVVSLKSNVSRNGLAENSVNQPALTDKQEPEKEGFLDIYAAGAEFGVLDGIGLTADIAGAFDPTPISDGPLCGY